MLVSPDVGLRPDLTAFALENFIIGLLGPDALNGKKLAEEGKWDTKGIMLGFLFRYQNQFAFVGS